MLTSGRHLRPYAFSCGSGEIVLLSQGARQELCYKKTRDDMVMEAQSPFDLGYYGASDLALVPKGVPNKTNRVFLKADEVSRSFKKQIVACSSYFWWILNCVLWCLWMEAVSPKDSFDKSLRGAFEIFNFIFILLNLLHLRKKKKKQRNKQL